MNITAVGFSNSFNLKKSGLKKQNLQDKHNTETLNKDININSLAFYGSRVVYRKPILNNEISKKIISKFQNFPEKGSMVKGYCSIFEIGGKKYGIFIDKADMNKTTFKVRNLVESVENWDKPLDSQSVLECTFDKNGVMINGELMKRFNKNYTRRFNYNIEGGSKRRIITEGMHFRPADGSNKELWNLIPDMSTNKVVSDMNFKREFEDIELAELFFELTRRNTTVLK